MPAIQTDYLPGALDWVERALAHSADGRERDWVAELFDALGELAKVMRKEAEETERLPAHLGHVNPDVRLVPTVERQAEQRRVKQSNLVERTYAIRESLRQIEHRLRDGSDPAEALAPISGQVRQLLKAFRLERRKETEFTLDAMNSNPGAGE